MPLECGGPAPASGGGPSSQVTLEGVQCYVTEATNGGPECLPVGDPTLVSRLLDNISSCGFALEFVIDDIESQPVLAGCDGLVECCASALPGVSPIACLDPVDDQQRQGACADALDSRISQSECSAPASADAGAGVDAGAPSAGDAGAAVSSRYALCCYRVCGYTRCI